MFTKPLSQIEYPAVEAFCYTFGEGARVEYKSEMIKDIPKIISAFANTLGGIIVIGVEADKIQNKVISINGISTKTGIEESILDSSLNGIYPSIIPEVKILDIPDKGDKILVVIKVHESVEAPHAIQNSTRVYIRTGSITQPYEMAEIDRIKYLLDRREKPLKLKEKLKQRAYKRISNFVSGSKIDVPYIYVGILPVFPYQPLIPLGDLYTFCNDLPHRYAYINDPQRIMDGVCKFAGNVGDFYYREINHYGLIFTCDTLDKTESRWKRSFGQNTDPRLYIRFVHFVVNISKALKLAEIFYGKCGYLGNVEVRIDAENIANEFLLYNEEGVPDFDEYKSVDNNVSSSRIIAVEDITVKLLDIVVSLLHNILWVFNCPVADPTPLIERILSANGMIK